VIGQRCLASGIGSRPPAGYIRLWGGLILQLALWALSMGFRFRRTLSIVPEARLNLSRGIPSVSVGVRALHYTVGPSGTRTTVGLPGSGLSYTSYRPYPTERRPEHSSTSPGEEVNTHRRARLESREVHRTHRAHTNGSLRVTFADEPIRGSLLEAAPPPGSRGQFCTPKHWRS
jgi:hypothetical protein